MGLSATPGGDPPGPVDAAAGTRFTQKRAWRLGLCPPPCTRVCPLSPGAGASAAPQGAPPREAGTRPAGPLGPCPGPRGQPGRPLTAPWDGESLTLGPTTRGPGQLVTVAAPPRTCRGLRPKPPTREDKGLPGNQRGWDTSRAAGAAGGGNALTPPACSQCPREVSPPPCAPHLPPAQTWGWGHRWGQEREECCGQKPCQRATGRAHFGSPPSGSEKTDGTSVQTSRPAPHAGAGVEAEDL